MPLQETVPAERLIQFPCTAPRRVPTFGKVLSHVDPKAACALGFEGRFVKPGSTIRESELPEPAVLLEFVSNPKRIRKKFQGESLYLLWCFDRVLGEWKEVARTWSHAWEWALELRPIAVRLLNPPRPRLVDYEGAGKRVEGMIDQELAKMTEPERWEFLNVVYNAVASRLTESDR